MSQARRQSLGSHDAIASLRQAWEVLIRGITGLGSQWPVDKDMGNGECLGDLRLPAWWAAGRAGVCSTGQYPEYSAVFLYGPTRKETLPQRTS
jgi:hypothetical protein